MASTEDTLSRGELVARRFGARAANYDEHARLQRESAARLCAFIEAQGGLPNSGTIIEVGCGTGLMSALLAPTAAHYVATDIAPEMLSRCRERLGHLPQVDFALRNGETDAFPAMPAAIVTNLTAQWFHDPIAGLARLARQTTLLAFSVPLAGSFPEWEQAFRALGRQSGLLPMPDEEALRQNLASFPGCTARFHAQRHTIHYESGKDFADSFRGIGAETPRPDYRPAPIRGVLKRFANGIDATARILYGIITSEKA